MSQGVSAEIVTPTTWFSRSKTRAPKFSIPLVERKRLLLSLDAALDKPVSCIVAPAGFGKSTLLSQWRESLLSRNIACAWINLDENDSEIRQFFAYLVFAFEDAGVSLGYLMQAAERGFVDMSSSSITISLLTAMGEIDKQIVLILDDYHRAACNEIDDFVKTISDQFGDTIHIAIGSRKPVQINLPNMLVAGRAIEIPSVQLRFSDREVWEAMGDNLDKEAITALQEQVEGWPVAVQMTRLLGGFQSLAVATSRERRKASQERLAEYLVTNVLDNQSEELREFLYETAILKSFNAQLADAVCRHDKSHLLIHQLKMLQALVVPMDDQSEWFRYHHLFSECLGDLLKHKDPEKFVTLHRRAAKWCGENRMVAEAVNYANVIKDYALSMQIINENSHWLRTEQFGGVGYFKGLLADIPEKEIVKDARILYTKVYASSLVGDSKDALYYHNIAEAIVEKEGVTPETFSDRLVIGTAILALTEFEMERGGGWLNDRLKITDAAAKTNSTAHAMSGLIRTWLALQALTYGDFSEARKHGLAAEIDFGHVTARIPILYCQICIGLIELWSNSPSKARKRFEKATAVAVEICGDQSNFKFNCDMFLGVIDYWQSGLDAEPVLELQKALMRAMDGDGGYDVYAVGFDAVVHDALCRQEYDKADALVDILEKSIDRLAIDRLIQFVEFMRLDCAVARNNLADAEMIFGKVRGLFDTDEKTFDDLGWYHRITAAYSCGRYLAATEQYPAALSYVEKGLGEADALDIVIPKVRGNILKASILERARNRDEALVAVEQAIEDAARIDCLRPFAADVPETLLAEAVTSVMEKNPARAVKDFLGKLTVVGAQKLFSSREEEVLQGIAQGKSNKEIARELDLTDNTIKFHLRNIYRKLGVKKRVPAVEKARELGLIS